MMKLDRMATKMKLCSLSRLRGRAGVGVSPRFTLSERGERALTRRCAPTFPASGRGEVNSHPGQPSHVTL
ncbi:hypothetical protein ACVJGD_002920 [Bradyrhizobium sp. USDA 10063]